MVYNEAIQYQQATVRAMQSMSWRKVYNTEYETYRTRKFLNKRTELVSKCRHGNCKNKYHKSKYNPAQTLPRLMQALTLRSNKRQLHVTAGGRRVTGGWVLKRPHRDIIWLLSLSRFLMLAESSANILCVSHLFLLLSFDLVHRNQTVDFNQF